MVDSKATPLGPEDVDVGDWIDVRDGSGLWIGCRIVDKSSTTVRVQTPQRWSSSTGLNDPCVPWSSSRLAHFRQHSQAGLLTDRRQINWEDTIGECQRCAEQLAELQATLPSVSGESSWKPVRITSLLCGNVPDLVDCLIGHDYVSAGAAMGARVLEANRFFLQVLQFFCTWLRCAPGFFVGSASPSQSAAAAHAAALLDLAAVFGRIFAAIDRRAAAFFEANLGIPEKHGVAAVWPGADCDWLRKAVTSASCSGSCEVNSAAVPLAWLLVKLRGLEDVAGPVDVSAIEDALAKTSLLNCNMIAFSVMGGIEDFISCLMMGCDRKAAEVSDKDLRVRPMPLEGMRAMLLPLGWGITAQNTGRSWLELTLPRILEGVRMRVSGMWDEEVKVMDRDQFVRCVCEPAASLLNAKPSRSEVDELRDELLLLFSRRRLQSPFLEKRLKALNDIKDVIDRTAPRAGAGWSLWGGSGRDASRKASSDSTGAASDSLQTPAGLARWIADDERYGLLPILFGSRAHPEVLRRASFILKLLAREQLLTCERLDALWLCGCSADKHEGLTCCVLDLLVEISSSLDRVQIEFLVGKIVDMPINSIDIKFVRFLRDFLLASVAARYTWKTDSTSTNSASADSSASNDAALGLGLSLFWQLLRADGSNAAPKDGLDKSDALVANPVVMKEARTCFLDLLKNPHFASHRDRHLHACWNALHEGLIDTSLVKLLRELLDTFPAMPSPGSTAIARDTMLWRLSNEDGKPQMTAFLLDRAIDALQIPPAKSNSSASEASLQSGALVMPVADTVDEKSRESEDFSAPYGDLAGAILETLLYALTESSLQINFADMDRLWRAVNDGSRCNRDLVAAWLSHVAGFIFAAKVFNRPHWVVWPEFEYVHFFQSVLRSSSETNFKNVSHDVLVCFLNYMKLCNMKLFNSALEEDKLHIPETPNCASLASGGGHSHGNSAVYSQLIGSDGSAKSGDLATAVGKRFRIMRWNLIGYEELWEIGMQVVDPVVFEECSDFLVSCVVFVHPSVALYRKRGEVQTTFLQRCMQTLESPDAGEDGIRCVHKVLMLLAKYLHFLRLGSYRNQTSAIWPVTPETEPSQRDRRSRSDITASFHIMYRTDNNAGLQEKTFYFNRSATLGSLRCKIASALRLPAKELGLYPQHGNQMLDWDLDCLTLDECNVPGTLFAAYVKPSPVENDAGSWQLSEQELDTFLDLLAESCPRFRCESPVWAILGRLPVHERITNVFRRVSKWGLEVAVNAGRRPLAHLLNEEGNADLHVPLPGGTAALATREIAAEFSKFWHGKVWHWCPDSMQQRRPQMHRLLYGLRVVHSLMLSGNANSTMKKQHDECLHLQISGNSRDSVELSGGAWSRGFLLAGGLELFLDVFGVIHSCQDALQCLSLLADIILELVMKWRDIIGQRNDLDATLQSRMPKFVSELMDVLLRAVNSGYEEESRMLTSSSSTSFTSYSAGVLRLCAESETTQNSHKAKPKSSEESLCISRIFLLLQFTLEHDPACVEAFRSFHHMADILKYGFFSSDSAVREATSAGIHTLCVKDPSNDSSLGGALLTILLFEVLPLWEQQPHRSDQVFHIIARLLQRHRSPQPAAMGLVLQPNQPAPCLDELHSRNGSQPIENLVNSLVYQLKVGTCVTTEDDANSAMLGLLQLIHSILHCFPHLKAKVSQTLAAELICSLLGPAAAAIPPLVGDAETSIDCVGAPRCQTNQSRQTAFALLHELATDNAEACSWVTQLLLAALVRPSARIGVRWQHTEWVIQPDFGMKSATGFVGLKNFGATCYMNSVLQQLFAHPEFQLGVLKQSPQIAYEANETEESKMSKTNGKELLYQLQVLFSSLRSSQRQYYSPKGFCTAFRDWEGRPVNVLQQMDADEFLSLLLDQLERVMGGASPSAEEAKKPGPRTLVRRLFGGTLCTEIIPKNSVAGRSERHEDFLVLSLQVKGKQSVRASLEAFVEGEMLEGDNAYFSEEAGCKVDALKRTCLDKLPETLIFVLKRFEFDFDTMQKVKLNDFCEFPMQLDMWPYTKEALDGGSPASGTKHEYVLKGIVLHSGTADSGHYSSLVKIEEKDTWYEFNDTVVTPMNEEDIPLEAFGGMRDDDKSAAATSIGFAGRSKNAYLLFYEKIAVHLDATDKRTSGDSSASQGEAIQQSVEAANCHHWYTQAMFSFEFSDFAWMFASNFYSSPALLASNAPTSMQAESVGALKFMQIAQLRRDHLEWEERLPILVANFVASYVFTILAHSRDRQFVNDWCSLLGRLLVRAGRSSQRWFVGLLASHGFVREVFLECPVQETRVAHLGVFVQCLRLIYDSEIDCLRSFASHASSSDMRQGQQWNEEPKANEPTRKGIDDKEIPILAKVWATLVELLPVAMQTEAHSRFAQFFDLIQEFLSLGPETLAWALKTESLPPFLEFALQDQYPGNATALNAAMEGARLWYQPNWLQVLPSDNDGGRKSEKFGEQIVFRPVAIELVLGTDGDETAEAVSSEQSGRSTNSPAEDSSFERQLQSEASGEFIELGPLWSIIALLLQHSQETISLPQCHNEVKDALLRRLVRIGGNTVASCPGASRLLRLLCKDNMERSQNVICRICERIGESDGQQLRGALRMGSALVALVDKYMQQRLVMLMKSVLHVARTNRKYFRTMHFVIHYIVKWCRRCPGLPQWLSMDAGGSSRCQDQNRWLEQWLKERSGSGGEWQGGGYSGNFATSIFGSGDSVEDARQPSRWTWCSEMIPYVRKIVKGEAITKEAIPPAAGDSDADLQESASSKRPSLHNGSGSGVGVSARSQLPILSKVQMATSLVAAQQRQQQQQAYANAGTHMTAW